MSLKYETGKNAYSLVYRRHGSYHRKHGPAIILPGCDALYLGYGVHYRLHYFEYGDHHRIDGPAWCDIFQGTEVAEYYIRGKPYSYFHFKLKYYVTKISYHLQKTCFQWRHPCKTSKT
jgi:hypothetical protein